MNKNRDKYKIDNTNVINNDITLYEGEKDSLYAENFSNSDHIFKNAISSPGTISTNILNTVDGSNDSLNLSPAGTSFENLNHVSSTTTINTNEDVSGLDVYRTTSGKTFSDFGIPRTYTNGISDIETLNAELSRKKFNSTIIFNDHTDSHTKLNEISPGNIFFTSEDNISNTMDGYVAQEKRASLDISKTEAASLLNPSKWELSNQNLNLNKILKKRKSITKNHLILRGNSSHEFYSVSESSSVTNIESDNSSISIPLPHCKAETSDLRYNNDNHGNENHSDDKNSDITQYEGIIMNHDPFAFSTSILRKGIKVSSFPTTSDINIGQCKTEIYSDVTDEDEISSNCLPTVFEKIDDLTKIEYALHRCEGCFKVTKQSYGCSNQLIKELPNLQVYKEYNTPNGYTLEYVREHASPEYIYMYSGVTNDYDPSIKRYSIVPHFDTKGKKMKRDYPSLCPFCKVTEKKPIDELFYERNNSCYRGHLINTHGINSTGEVAKLPKSGFVCYKLGKNCWIKTYGFRCPYVDCNTCFLKGDKTHGFHEYIRHWNRYHIN